MKEDRNGAWNDWTRENGRLDLLQISKIWQFGSVIRSWLLDLTVDALSKNPKLEGIGAYVTDSGEGRWTVIEGVELGVPLPVISGALDMRFRSQDPEPFANKLLAMMRHEFGGHAVKTAARDCRAAPQGGAGVPALCAKLEAP